MCTRGGPEAVLQPAPSLHPKLSELRFAARHLRVKSSLWNAAPQSASEVEGRASFISKHSPGPVSEAAPGWCLQKELAPSLGRRHLTASGCGTQQLDFVTEESRVITEGSAGASRSRNKPG